MPDPAKSNEVDMPSKIQILTRAMSLNCIDTVSEASGNLFARQYAPVDTIIADYKKLYAALTAEE